MAKNPLPLSAALTIRLAGVAALAGLAVGCARPKPEPAPTKPTEVIVDRPTLKEVNEYEDFPGRTDAVAAVDIRARVTGYLNQIAFKDGSDVKKDDLLFVIDPTQYQAEVNRAEAQLKFAQAHQQRLEKDFARVTALASKQAVSRGEEDQVAGDLAEAKANVGVSHAALQLAKQNLDWTRVTAPLTGRISRRMIDPGNLVKADDTILTSIVRLDVVYVNFNVDERTLLRIRRLIQEGKVTSIRKRETHVKIGVADEDEFSLDGVMVFSDNKVDPGTGTLLVRAEVENVEVNGNRLLSPGQFVRVRLPVGTPKPAILVPEEAVGTDQGQKYLYVVNAKSEVEYRPVKLGQQFDQYRVVESGLTPEDQVVVSGLQRIRPGAKVTAKTATKPQEKKPAETPKTVPKPQPPATQPAAVVPPKAAATGS